MLFIYSWVNSINLFTCGQNMCKTLRLRPLYCIFSRWHLYFGMNLYIINRPDHVSETPTIHDHEYDHDSYMVIISVHKYFN